MIEWLERPTDRCIRFGPADRDAGPADDRPVPRLMPDVFGTMLDEVDCPIVLVARNMRVLHANKAAQWCFDAAGALRRVGDGLHLQGRAEHAELASAVDAAASRNLRGFVRFGDARAGRGTVAVVPQRDGNRSVGALLIFSRFGLCEPLSMQACARNHGPTASETRVLGALCAGHSALAIARQHGVAMSTVRTQLNSLRAKTGARDTGDLLRRVAVLAPLVNALRPSAAGMG